MFKKDAVKFFGTKTRLAHAAGVDRSAVSQWGELIPEARAVRLQVASGGALIYDPAVYDQYKQNRKEALNHDNQSSES